MDTLFENNRKWAEEIKRKIPDFFLKLSRQQNPKFLWIGCADSRVPANEITGLLPGELFVHRNIANMVVHTDFNCLSVLQYAIDFLHVEHIIVCGHYGCGGVRAALEGTPLGLANNWIRHIQDVVIKHKQLLDSVEEFEEKLRLLCKLNVIEQTYNVANTTMVQEMWNKRPLGLHGWVYGIENGLLTDLHMSITNKNELDSIYYNAIQRLQVK